VQATAKRRWPLSAEPDLAASLNNLGNRLSQLGRPADALPLTAEAVRTYRELTAASPGRYRTDLARSLSNLGHVLAALGRDDDAAPLHTEALGLAGDAL
jgi:tetratricopeptide (TPR) repeat protein